MDLPEKCACLGGNLDHFLQPIILSILKEGPQTGYVVMKRIAEYSTFRGNGPDPTGVYRYLKILWGKGIIGKEVHPNTDKGETAPYHLTPLGEECLERWCHTLRDYSRRIQALVKELEPA